MSPSVRRMNTLRVSHSLAKGKTSVGASSMLWGTSSAWGYGRQALHGPKLKAKSALISLIAHLDAAPNSWRAARP